jgi:dihydroxy-acid dehydratase
VSPEAFVGGPIAVVQDGDPITIDTSGGGSDSSGLDLGVSPEELEARLKAWHEAGESGSKDCSGVVRAQQRPVSGILAKYRATVQSAHVGALTR